MTAQNPLSQAFETQRAAIEAFQRTIATTVAIQQRHARSLARGITIQAILAEEGLATARKLTLASLRGADAWVPGTPDTFRTTLEEGFDAVEELQSDSWEIVDETVSGNVAVYDRAADEYAERADTSFDAFLDVYEHVVSDAATVPIETPGAAATTGSEPAPEEATEAATPEPVE